MIEEDKAGISIHNVTISGLFYCDDLILIGKNTDELDRLTAKVQGMLEDLEMRINCDKSNRMYTEKAAKTGKCVESWELKDTWGETLGSLSRSEQYKYLGIKIEMGSGMKDFEAHVKGAIGKMKSMANLSLSMAVNTAIPVPAGRALWTGCVLPSVLYAAEVIALNMADLRAMESIQTSYAANLIKVGRKGAPSVGVRTELGLLTLRRLVDRAKMRWWARACHLPEDSWTKQALYACLEQVNRGPQAPWVPWCAVPDRKERSQKHKGENPRWTSSYLKEIKEINERLGMGTIKRVRLLNQKDLIREVSKRVQEFHRAEWEKEMTEKRLHSLRALPDCNASEAEACKKYLIFGGPNSSSMAKFRLGDGDLGNRVGGGAAGDVCPVCKSGPNIEGHLIFQCVALSDLRSQRGEELGIESLVNGTGAGVQTLDKAGVSTLLKTFLSPTPKTKGEVRMSAYAELENIRKKVDFIHDMWEAWKERRRDLLKEAGARGGGEDDDREPGTDEE
jgi:hypothetical protein